MVARLSAYERTDLQNTARRLFRVGQLQRDEYQGWVVEVYAAMADLGWIGIVAPEECGGVGGALEDLAIILSEAGRIALPGSIVTSVVAAKALELSGESSWAQDLLRQIIGGRSAALGSCEGEWTSPSVATLQAEWRGNGFAVTGIVAPVANGRWDHLILEARTARQESENDGALFAVDTDQSGISARAIGAIGRQEFSEIRLEGVWVPVSQVLAEGPHARFITKECLAYGSLGEAAYATGLAERLVELTVEYARERKQFGSPIGGFQSVQSHCVDAVSDLETLRSILKRAVIAMDDKAEDRHRLAAVAKAWAGEVLPRTADHAHRVFGAIGFSGQTELAALSHAAQLSRFWFGTPQFHRSQLAGGLAAWA
jgi:alkylation response protein AidB-like acyl-CoA dehydrogenase